MIRSTKIVATIGPASTDPVMLEKLILAGVNTVRLNFSHGTAQDHIDRATTVRAISAKLGMPVAILGDLQGPKIRIGKFAEGRIVLNKGDKFILDANCTLGNQERVGIDYKELPNDVSAGDTLLLGDGEIQFQVDSVQGVEVFCTVLVGGPLSNNKGINRKGGGLTAPALTEKDMEDIKTAAKLGADYIAVSFPKCADDMQLARTLLKAAGSKAGLIAKIERTEAIANLDSILDASEGIMVARGDLAVEMGDFMVPTLQKMMIKAARRKRKLTIVATQMMESMINCPVPTRAEASDAANAVLDGADAIMLSAESASGKYPVEAVEAMVRICLQTEKVGEIRLEASFDEVSECERVEQAVAMSALQAAKHMPLKAMVALTKNGSSALWLSRCISGMPIHAFTACEEVYRKLGLCRHVQPILVSDLNDATLIEQAKPELLRRNHLAAGDFIAVTHGKEGAANLSIVRV